MMVHTLLAVCLLLIVQCLSGYPKSLQGHRLDNKNIKAKYIIGGRYAKDNQFPYQAYVEAFVTTASYSCGGSIISSRHVLTAAHCVNIPNLTKVEVVVGDVNIRSKKALPFDVEMVHFYPIKTQGIKNDIVILKVSEPFPVNLPNVNVIKLQKKRHYYGTNCYVSGWGDTRDNTKNEDWLQFVRVPIVRRETCLKRYGYMKDIICAGYLRGGKDTCKGDSGGPLVCDGLLTGVVQGGYGCGLPHYPGTYTEVAYYYPWIKDVLFKDSVETNYVQSLYYHHYKMKRQN